MSTIFKVKIMPYNGKFTSALIHKAPNTTTAEYENTVDLDEMAHDEQSHLEPQSLPSSLCIFNILQVEKIFFFLNFADVILPSAF